MRVLVYKMTHLGDPDPRIRVWGWTNCMGRVRGYRYDAVVAVGGISAVDGIAGKLVWTGVGPHGRGDSVEPEVTFDKFRFFSTNGPTIEFCAPALARHLYDKRARYLLNLSPEEEGEALRLIAVAPSASTSPHLPRARRRRCIPRGAKRPS